MLHPVWFVVWVCGVAFSRLWYIATRCVVHTVFYISSILTERVITWMLTLMTRGVETMYGASARRETPPTLETYLNKYMDHRDDFIRGHWFCPMVSLVYLHLGRFPEMPRTCWNWDTGRSADPAMMKKVHVQFALTDTRPTL